MKTLILIITLIISPFVAQAATDAVNLKYHYKFNNNLNDEISGTPLTTTNCPGTNYEFRADEDGTANQAIYFKNDNTDCILEATGDNFSSPPTDITVSFWMKTDMTGEGGSALSVLKQKVVTQLDEIILIIVNQLVVYQSNQPFILTEFQTENQVSHWHHFAFVRDSSNNAMIAYLDGAQFPYNDISNLVNFDIGYLSFGGDPVFSKYSKQTYISDFKFYDVALSNKEIFIASSKKPLLPAKIVAQGCTSAGLSTTDYTDLTLDTNSYCVKNECIQNIPSNIQKVVIPNQARVFKTLNLISVLDYDPSCIEVEVEYTLLSGVFSDYLSVEALQVCESPCEVQFTYKVRDTGFVLSKSVAQIAFTNVSTEKNIVDNLSSTSSAMVQGSISTVSNPAEIILYQSGNTSFTIGEKIRILHNTGDSAINIGNHDFQVKLVSVSDSGLEFIIPAEKITSSDGANAGEIYFVIEGYYIFGQFTFTIVETAK